MNTRNRRNRKIKWIRIVVILLIVLGLASLGGWLTGKISSASQESAYKSQLQERVDAARTVEKMAEEAVYDRNIDAESFNAIIDYAEEDLDSYVRMLQAHMQGKITKESYEEAISAFNPTDYYRRILSNLSYYSREQAASFAMLQAHMQGKITKESYEEAISAFNPTDYYRRILSNLSYYSREQAASFARDKDLLEYMAYYPSRQDHMNPPETITPGMDWFAYISQWDPDWAYMGYQGSTIGEAGSRPVTISMAIAQLKNDQSATPWVIAQKLDAPLTEEETMLYGAADLDSRTSAIFSEYGITETDLGMDFTAVNNALSSGGLILVRAPEGTPDHWLLATHAIFSEYGITETDLGMDFTAVNNALSSGGLILVRAPEGTPDHWLLATQDGEGKLRVLDSESRSSSDQEWSLEQLMEKGSQFILLSAS